MNTKTANNPDDATTAFAPSCRILCLTTHATHARIFVDRLKALTGDARTDNADSVEETESIVPWTIVNKYYSANIHFEIRDITEWGEMGITTDVPAVVFIWTYGEPWREHAQYIARELQMGNHEPEVILAVRLRSTRMLNMTSSDSPEQNSADADDEDLDESLSQLGFEFVDAHQVGDQASQDRADTGIPDLPRVIDALSTIMWPSMTATQQSSQRRRTQVDLDDWVKLSAEFMAETEELVVSSGGENSTKQFPQDELVTPPMSAAPTDKGNLRFDDDFFAEFVSVPAVRHQSESFDTEGVETMHTGASYATLGSVSNFDGEGPEPEDALPSKEEVHATSERIFGSALPSMSNENDLDAFDLHHVLTTLDSMKWEISEMDSDADRRDAAAKVALAFMHGLQMDD